MLLQVVNKLLPVLVRALQSKQPAVLTTAVTHVERLAKLFGAEAMDRCIPGVCAEVRACVLLGVEQRGEQPLGPFKSASVSLSKILNKPSILAKNMKLVSHDDLLMAMEMNCVFDELFVAFRECLQ